MVFCPNNSFSRNECLMGTAEQTQGTIRLAGGLKVTREQSEEKGWKMGFHYFWGYVFFHIFTLLLFKKLLK